MLVLTRREGEALLIGDTVRVVVVRTKDGSVRLGVEAPSHVLVLREEVIDRESPKAA